MELIKNRNLNLLLSGQLVSQIGDKFYILALSYWVLEETGSPALMGIVLFSTLFPMIIAGFVSGAFIDRYNRKIIIILTDLVRGLVIAGVGLAYYIDKLSLSIILTSQVLLSISSAFFNPAIPSIIPQIVKKRQLAKANSKTQFIAGFSSIAGPILGGMSVAYFGYQFVFLFNSISFFISAFFESFIRLPKLPRKNETNKSMIGDILAGYQYLMMRKNLLVILFMVAIIHFFVGSIEVIMPVLASGFEGNGPKNLGFLQTFFGLGSVLMALCISIYNIDQKEVKLLFSSVFGIGVVYFLSGASFGMGLHILLPFLFYFLLLGAALVLAGTSFQSILQKTVEKEFSGRVFGVVSSVGNVTIPFATLIYGFLLSYFKYKYLLILSGLVLLPLSYFSYKIYTTTPKNNLELGIRN